MAEAFPSGTSQPIITWEEKLEKAQSYKAEGNTFYQESNYKSAIGKYHRAILYLKGIEGALQGLSMGFGQSQNEAAIRISDAGKAEVQLLKIACYNNLAGMYCNKSHLLVLNLQILSLQMYICGYDSDNRKLILVLYKRLE